MLIQQQLLNNRKIEQADSPNRLEFQNTWTIHNNTNFARQPGTSLYSQCQVEKQIKAD